MSPLTCYFSWWAQFCTYHSTYVRANGAYVYYVVMPDMGGACASGCGTEANPFDRTTLMASKSLVNAVTDPAVGLATYCGPSTWAGMMRSMVKLLTFATWLPKPLLVQMAMHIPSRKCGPMLLDRALLVRPVSLGWCGAIMVAQTPSWILAIVEDVVPVVADFYIVLLAGAPLKDTCSRIRKTYPHLAWLCWPWKLD